MTIAQLSAIETTPATFAILSVGGDVWRTTPVLRRNRE